MRTSNFSRNHAYAKARGWVGAGRAANNLPVVSDGVNEATNISEILISGGTVSEPEDGVALITIGGLAQSSNSGPGTGPGSGGSFPNSGGMPVYMRNNSSIDLSPGDVVVTDPTDDSAVTTTSTASNTRIAGVVQAVIPRLAYGPVLFNGFASVVNTTGTVTRGNYALTSSTAARAAATASRVAGSFAVYLTGSDLPDFAAASTDTTAPTPVTELEIDMPALVPVGRILFLALWLESGVSNVEVDGWTQIGAETGYYYFTRESQGDNSATAAWTTASTAVATVLVLHPNVTPVGPIASHDYDSTTSAAAVSGLTGLPRYAIAGVNSVTTPGSGFVRLGGGAASFDSSGGTPALVQSKFGSAAQTFDSTLTTGNTMIAIPFKVMAGSGGLVHSIDPRQGGVCPQDSNMTKFEQEDTNNFGSVGRNGTAILGKVVSGDTYSGPFDSNGACDGAVRALLLMEFENIGISGYEVLTANDSSSTPVNCGTFTVGANDLVIMAVVGKSDGFGGSPDPVIAPNGFTQVVDGYGITNGWVWAGYKVGDGDASVTFSNGAFANGGWAAIAVHLTQGAQSAAGTLAGKYIGTASSATSPFTGGGAQNDAIFAINLLKAAQPSALLYGPDLGSGGGSEPTADAHIADTSDAHDASAVSLLDSAGLFTATDVEAAIAELAAKDIGYQAHGNMGASETFSAATSWHSGTFDANSTFTFSGATSGIVASMVLELTENGTGGFSPTWPGSVVWPGGVTPTHTTTAGTTSIYLFQSRDGGTTWYGFQAGGGSAVGDLDDLSDVTITSPAADQQLQYVGGVWVNNSRRWEPVTHNPGTGPELVFSGDDIVMAWRTY